MSFYLLTVQRYDIFFNPTILFPLFSLQIPHLLTFVMSSPISLTLVNVTLNNAYFREFDLRICCVGWRICQRIG